MANLIINIIVDYGKLTISKENLNFIKEFESEDLLQISLINILMENALKNKYKKVKLNGKILGMTEIMYKFKDYMPYLKLDIEFNNQIAMF